MGELVIMIVTTGDYSWSEFAFCGKLGIGCQVMLYSIKERGISLPMFVLFEDKEGWELYIYTPTLKEYARIGLNTTFLGGKKRNLKLPSLEIAKHFYSNLIMLHGKEYADQALNYRR